MVVLVPRQFAWVPAVPVLEVLPASEDLPVSRELPALEEWLGRCPLPVLFCSYFPVCACLLLDCNQPGRGGGMYCEVQNFERIRQKSRSRFLS